MGFIFKSAVGLGAVYFAMFGQAVRDSEVAPTAKLCASAIDQGSKSKLAAAGCALGVSAQYQRINAPAAPPPAPPPAAKAVAGSLTEADLRDPWFGPTRVPRKTARRG